ncbi:MAG: carbon-nitrogen hydrolase family protein [Chromatiaceae bacterium]|nr:carbon-nitrogen hydrolase family protein [Chromatiaceae bacterium]MCP5444498.1 carbon-nitrogen hydrolase family protein [Chromatiaceae bacterium]
MTPFAIAGIQMRVSASHENIAAMAHKLDITMARFPWVQMVMFSELAAFGPLPGHAQALPGPAEAAFQEMAVKHGIWLLPGSMFEDAGDRIYNTAPVIDPNGQVVKRYRKMFPFQPYENHVASGTEFAVFDVPEVGRFGVSICYDMWFPETSRTLVSMGAEVILHPTMTDTIDRDVELSIARATAVTNQCYFFDINGVGDGGVGSSIIVGPAGYIIHQAGGGEETIPVEINLGRVRRERAIGIRSLGQPLKSFRDRPVEFPAYQRDEKSEAYLQSLGPLTKPHRGSVAGLKGQQPTPEELDNLSLNETAGFGGR